MDFLEKRITGDWIEVREKLLTPLRLKTYFKLDDLKVAGLPQDLRQVTMEGIVEYKRRLVNGIFNFFSRLTFTTPSQEEILATENQIQVLIYLLGVESLFAAGHLRPAKEVESPLAGSNSRNRPPVEQVVQEVKNRVSQNPELAKDSHVKNILMEIQVYQKEFAQFAALSPKIPDDRASTFFLNYKQRLDGILANIHSHFREIQMAEDSALRKEYHRVEEEVFVLPALVKLLATQAQELTKMRSTIFHALQEGYQIRNLLLKLTERKDPFLALIDEELRLLDSRQEPETTNHPVAVKLARSIAQALESNALKKL